MIQRLREEGMRMWTKKKRPPLNATRAAARLEWALAHKNWTAEQWKHVLWSDECSVERSKGVRQQWVYRTPLDKWKPWAIQPNRSGSRCSIMVWAAFDGWHRSDLVFCQRDPESARGGVTARSYLQLLKVQLPQLCGEWTMFVHDNAPIHSAGIIQDYLKESGYKTMSWPPYSPDMNLIEHCWGPLKEKVHELVPDLLDLSKAQAEERLGAVLPIAWQAIPRAHMDKLIAGMPKRVAAILEAEGWYTRF